MNKVGTIFRRELRSYFATPLAYVFIVIFLVLASVFTFQVGGLLERGQADLQPFFRWHPWLYLVLIPAISMRLWAEERNSGSIELLMTLPITLWQAVTAKFLAAWVFAGIALLLTFPVWLIMGKGVPVEGDGCFLFFPGLQENFFEALQFLERPRQAGAGFLHIDLRHLRAGAAARVGDLKFNRHRQPGRVLGGSEVEICVFELRVGKAVTEGEQRLDLFGVEPAITDEEPFLVNHRAVFARVGIQRVRR